MTLSALTAADQASPPQTQADGTINQIATIGAVRVVSKQTRLTDRPQRAYDREAGTNHLRGVTDALGCRTAYTYDSVGNIASITQMAVTAKAVAATSP
jgi:YD repeat-containing protein